MDLEVIRQLHDSLRKAKRGRQSRQHANVLYPPAVARALEAGEESPENSAVPPVRSPTSKKLLRRCLPRHLAQLEPQPLRAELLSGCLSGFEDARGGGGPSDSESSANVQPGHDEKTQCPPDQMPSQSSRPDVDDGNPEQQITGPYPPVLNRQPLRPVLAPHYQPRSARAMSSSKTELERSPKLRSARRPVVLKGLWYEGSFVLVPPAALLAEGGYNAPVVPGVLPLRPRRSRKRSPSQLPQGTHQLSGYLSQVDRVDRPSGIIEAVAEEDSDPDD